MASHTVLKEQLLEMGFEAELIDGALSLLKENATLESVLEAIETGKAQTAVEQLKNNPVSDPSQSAAAVSEPTPEELEQRKKAVEDKIKQRRKEIEEKEKEMEKEREMRRRKDGQDMGKMRDELQRMQQENYVKTLKREKEEEKAAREAIRRQIEQDKAERREKFASGSSSTGPPATSTPPTRPSELYNSSSKDGKTKLAIRLADNTNMIQEFDAKEVLSAVRAFIVTQKNINYDITLAMPLRPPFSEEDMAKSLLVLGLVPNARLQVIKR